MTIQRETYHSYHRGFYLIIYGSWGECYHPMWRNSIYMYAYLHSCVLLIHFLVQSPHFLIPPFIAHMSYYRFSRESLCPFLVLGAIPGYILTSKCLEGRPTKERLFGIFVSTSGLPHSVLYFLFSSVYLQIVSC